MRMSTTVFADIITRHLDAFKFVTADERALVHRAFELAPSEPLPGEAFAAYLGTAAAAAWEAIRYLPLSEPNRRGYTLTLDELAGGECAPTQRELLVVLGRAADIMEGI
ncbi:hypothetical protein FM104_12915 [Microbacterium esteraromaticum]|uniref:Uncharacterized protein n=2 Tax=Microbacterium esteraromaticum TaxID=57043 RepID=A0A1R4KHU7_9MICO|nr:hypothetical protein FM104_12915 [Microbacterium esteraromaticum]